MDCIGSEVSQKIRAAIKAKLIELGAYVDDELPDYIMVMVANKRTRSQMDEDLQLFLSSNTKIFTSWLHTVLQKLQEVTVATFEGKKDSGVKKSKHKKEIESDTRSRKSSEEIVEKIKKHGKKHKEEKKLKKNKHKSKEKKSKLGKEKEEMKTSQEKDKISRNKKFHLNDVVGKAILGDLKKNKKLKSDKDESSSQSSGSSVEGSLTLKEKQGKENGNDNSKQGYVDEDILKMKVDNESNGNAFYKKTNKNELIEDEFNIEPLKPTEKSDELDSVQIDDKINKETKNCESLVQVETTISAPTEELLKEHDKLQNQKLAVEEKAKKNNEAGSNSEDSLSPEEMRKQLLLCRAKKKLEESKLAKRMRSNSPDGLILEETSRLDNKPKESFPSMSCTGKPEASKSPCSRDSPRSVSPNRRSKKLSHSYSSDRSQSPVGSSTKKGISDYKSKTTEAKNSEIRKLTSSKPCRNSPPPSKEERKKNVIKISENLELEKNLEIKKETDKNSKEKETSKRRPVSSRVVTITGPEAPEIPSIIKVKPREYIPKDKQASKALILKAVAEAEKSIAAIQPRMEPEVEPTKSEPLFTKNLRGKSKRYEKLAVTLSNIRKSPDRLDRRVSADSEKSERSRLKLDSSDVSGGHRVRSEFSKKLSKSEDQFISSKTSLMEKNDKYIRCWLEGVEKAVKDDEMVNPSEMENLIHSNYTDDENDESESIKKEDKKRKRPNNEAAGDTVSKNKKLSDKEIANVRLIPNTAKADESPQIVVTFDGLNSKTIKDLMLKNKETVPKTILSSGKKLEEKLQTGLEKISDRFGRLNKTTTEDEGKKNSKYSSGNQEKTTTESKNRQLIAQLSEKFGKVDREFEDKKRKRPEESRRYSYDSRKNDKDGERNEKYRRSERRSIREKGFGFYRRS